jgi:hypothetical protein
LKELIRAKARVPDPERLADASAALDEVFET